MFEVYVLKSIKDGIRYVGYGSSAQQRLIKHNKGDHKFTKGHKPWKLLYTEKYETKTEAIKREKFLKSGKGREWLDQNNYN